MSLHLVDVADVFCAFARGHLVNLRQLRQGHAYTARDRDGQIKMVISRFRGRSGHHVDVDTCSLVGCFARDGWRSCHQERAKYSSRGGKEDGTAANLFLWWRRQESYAQPFLCTTTVAVVLAQAVVVSRTRKCGTL